MHGSKATTAIRAIICLDLIRVSTPLYGRSMVDNAGIRSLGVLAEEVRTEREFQLRHFDAVDAKAGIILGFAGAVVAFAPGGHLVIQLAWYVAAVSALLALWTFWPRRFWTTELGHLRDLYLAADEPFTRLRLLDTQILMVEASSRDLNRKAWRLKLAMTVLAIAALLTATGTAVH